MTLAAALEKARAGETGTIVIDEAWVTAAIPLPGGFTYAVPAPKQRITTTRYSPGAVDLDWLRERMGITRTWTPADAR